MTAESPDQQGKDAPEDRGFDEDDQGSREPRARLLGPPSLKWFLYGISPSIALVLLPETKYSWFCIAPHEMCLLLLVLFVTPFCFLWGARLAWKERTTYRVRARVSRWLNLLGLAFYLGLMVRLLVVLLVLMGR